MAKNKSTNAELAKAFLDHLKGQGFDVFIKRHRPKEDPLAIAAKFLFVLPAGGSGKNTQLSEFEGTLHKWLIDNDAPKSGTQESNIMKEVWKFIEYRDELI